MNLTFPPRLRGVPSLPGHLPSSASSRNDPPRRSIPAACGSAPQTPYPRTPNNPNEPPLGPVHEPKPQPIHPPVPQEPIHPELPDGPAGPPSPEEPRHWQHWQRVPPFAKVFEIECGTLTVTHKGAPRGEQP